MTAILDLGEITKELEAPLAVITTDTVDKARRQLARLAVDAPADGLAEALAMCGIDDQGLADGIARGLWTAVPA